MNERTNIFVQTNLCVISGHLGHLVNLLILESHYLCESVIFVDSSESDDCGKSADPEHSADSGESDDYGES